MVLSQYAAALGNDRPPILHATEKALWSAIVIMAYGFPPQKALETFSDAYQKLISSAEMGDAASWFHAGITPSASSSSLQSPPQPPQTSSSQTSPTLHEDDGHTKAMPILIGFDQPVNGGSVVEETRFLPDHDPHTNDGHTEDRPYQGDTQRDDLEVEGMLNRIGNEEGRNKHDHPLHPLGGVEGEGEQMQVDVERNGKEGHGEKMQTENGGDNQDVPPQKALEAFSDSYQMLISSASRLPIPESPLSETYSQDAANNDPPNMNVDGEDDESDQPLTKKLQNNRKGKKPKRTNRKKKPKKTNQPKPSQKSKQNKTSEKAGSPILPLRAECQQDDYVAVIARVCNSPFPFW